MPKYLATYDFKDTIPDPHATFLQKAVQQGWQVWILTQASIWNRLPNTTIIGEFASQVVADRAFDAAVAATAIAIRRPVIVEKYILVDYQSALIASDQQQKKVA